MNAEKRIRIIMAGSIPPPYHGSSVYFSELINSELKDIYELYHLDISDHRDLKNLSKLDFTNVFIAVKSLFNLFRLIRKVKPAIVYIPVSSNYLPYLRDGLMILTASFFSNAKIVIHLHEGNYFRNTFYNNSFSLYKSFIRYSLSKVHTAIVYSETLKSNFTGFVKNIVAFPNGLDRNPLRESTGKNKDKKNTEMTFLGNFFESKGLFEVLNSSVDVIKKFGNVNFNFAGSWSENENQSAEKIEKIIETNNIRNHIKFFIGLNGKEREELLLNTDILLFPTYYPYEGCPLVIIEAMAYSIPVISTKDVGAIPEMVEDGITGILIEKKNTKMLTDAIFRLIENPLLREEMGMAGRRKYEKYFTKKKNTENIINTFYKVLN